MKKHRKNNFTISKLKGLLLTMFCSLLMAIFVWLVSQFKEPPGIGLGFFIWLLISSFFIWESITYSLKNRRNWLLSFVVGVVVFEICFFIFGWIMHWVVGSSPPTWFNMIVSLIFGAVISSLIVGVLAILSYRKEWFLSQIENERMEKAEAVAKFEALQIHTDPHFLFNNFNSLYSLISENPEKAQQFLEKLSNIYRYILQGRSKQIVRATEEWSITEQYLSLLEIRYNNVIIIERKFTTDELSDYFLPPLSIQQLVENAVKHNRIDEETLFKIEFSLQENLLIVRNSHNPKRDKGESFGIGLQNLKERFYFLTDQLVDIENANGIFQVKLPLLESL